ncbi:MAG: 50S ribosomal protein L29 [Actinobacteria bacterium]|jgi:large subunit ribosomal protein L29|nr:50S ribosomal protein L29 [Actinomycetota bacterium]
MAHARNTERKELNDMDLRDLVEELATAKQAALNLRFQHATGQLSRSSELTTIKRRIARINTLIRAREIAAAESAGK